MNTLYQACLSQMRETSAIGSAAGVVSWDQETMMPPAADGVRAEQMAALAGVIHERIVDPRLGKNLRALTKRPAGLTGAQRACVREWLRDHERSAKVPAVLVQEIARTASLSQAAWIKARKASDFAAFAPWLKKMVELKRREAKAIGYKKHPYDALVDGYEPGMTVAQLDPIIGGLLQGLVPIVKAIAHAPRKNSDALLRKDFPEAGQEAIGREVMQAIGVDLDASRLDRSAHPFCCGMAPTDVRITTRYATNWLPQALYGVIHESGHALYEQGLPVKHFGTPLCEAVSLGIHESQSRLWENVIGRGLPFVQFLLPRLRRLFPRQLKGVTAQEFYRAVNRVGASPIRVEADEVTYNLHIALRYELEKGLLEGSIRVPQLPKLWNARMRSYLGITPRNDAEGVLQDTHWAQGLIGYFPTYLLGNLNAAQLWMALRRDVKGVDSRIRSGDFSPILGWLRTNVHQHGRRYRPAELIRRATGRAPDPNFFLDALRAKYGEIYGIQRW